MKYIVITGSVLSGIGKGITSSSLGLLFKLYGKNVTTMKIDGYLNVGNCLIRPSDHGETFITEDGGECDLDIGSYERFLNITLSRNHNLTSGKLYKKIIEKEMRGDYLGQTVQVIPHVTGEIQNWIHNTSLTPVDKNLKQPDICIIELGGVISDIENLIYTEALRQFTDQLGKQNVCHVHVSYMPHLKTTNELKTKTLQTGVAKLRELGIRPDFLCVRCEKQPTPAIIKKISDFCQIPKNHIISNRDISSIYRVPLLFDQQNVIQHISKQLNINIKKNDIMYQKWANLSNKFDKLLCFDELDEKNDIKHITIVGKYTDLQDAYISLIHSIKHAAVELNVKIKIQFLESTDLESTDLESKDNDKLSKGWDILKQSDGVIIPGGFGERGIEGMILTTQYCRENNVPCLGICLGMQIQVIEICRNILKLKNANSAEFDFKTPYPVIKIIKEDDIMGGTMRLGLHTTYFSDKYIEKSKVYDIYKKHGLTENHIFERHRHRYEVNPDFINKIENNTTAKFTGKSKDYKRMEILELFEHNFYIGVQYHPEYQTYPDKPHPLFIGFLTSTF